MTDEQRDAAGRGYDLFIKITLSLLGVLLTVVAYQGSQVIQAQANNTKNIASHDSKLANQEARITAFEKALPSIDTQLANQKVIVEAVANLAYISQQMSDVRTEMKELRADLAKQAKP